MVFGVIGFVVIKTNRSARASYEDRYQKYLQEKVASLEPTAAEWSKAQRALQISDEDAIHASVTNKKALDIKNEALSMYKESYQQAKQALELVGKWKIRIIESFEEFIQLIERIQGRPEGLIKEASPEELNSFTIGEIL